MPSVATILSNLTRAANDFAALAIAWHLLVLGWMLALLSTRRRPPAQLTCLLLALPLTTVSGVAWLSGNPVNGFSFSLLTLLHVSLAARIDTPLRRGPRWATALGAASVCFALVYPHFVEVGSVLGYALRAPVGIVPCPTLSLVLGAGLLADGFGDRAWQRTLAAAGLLYAVVGVVVLRVWIDVGLAIAAGGLLALSVRSVTVDDRTMVSPAPPTHV